MIFVDLYYRKYISRTKKVVVAKLQPPPKFIFVYLKHRNFDTSELISTGITSISSPAF